MPNYYVSLGVTRYVGQRAIHAAYRHLKLVYGPGGPIADEAKFREVQEAYIALGNSARRAIYDFELSSDPPRTLPDHIQRFAAMYFNYSIPSDNPHQYDHYTYLNMLLRLEGAHQFMVGQVIVNYPDLWEKLDYVIYSINRVTAPCAYNKEEDTRSRVELHDENVYKQSSILSTFACPQAKLLYDVSLGLETTEEQRRLKSQIGDITLLKDYLRKDYKNILYKGIFALQRAGCLTPENFQALMKAGMASPNITLWACSMSSILNCLSSSGLLTQANFNHIIRCNTTSEVAFSLGELHKLGILNEENFQLIVQKIPDINFSKPLFAIREEGIITSDDVALLHWRPSASMQMLNHQINQMFAHGLFLLGCDENKGKVAMLLALSLKKKLKLFCDKEPAEQEIGKERFKTAFIRELTSEDWRMSIHRAQWKVVVANIALALTLVGAVVIGVNYLLHGRGLFKTTREKHVDAIKETVSNSL